MLGGAVRAKKERGNPCRKWRGPNGDDLSTPRANIFLGQVTDLIAAGQTAVRSDKLRTESVSAASALSTSAVALSWLVLRFTPAWWRRGRPSFFESFSSDMLGATRMAKMLNASTIRLDIRSATFGFAAFDSAHIRPSRSHRAAFLL